MKKQFPVVIILFKEAIFYGKKKKNDLSNGKKQIIAGLLNEYDIKTAEDIQDALKYLLGGTIKNIMEAEMDEHLDYEKG